LLAGNSTSEELVFSELRGLVLDARGTVVERRLVWQQALGQLARDKSAPARGEALIFNPLLFRSVTRGTRVRFELDAVGTSTGSHTATVTIAPVDCQNRHVLELPLRGRVLIYDGYDLYSHHRRSDYGGPENAAMGISDNFQRFGLDLVVVDEQSRFFRGNGSRPDQWLGWGQPVYAAGSGTVAAVSDGQADNEIMGQLDKWVDRDLEKNPMTTYGNYVLIEHAPNEFSLVAHLRNGTVRVRPGTRVVRGQIVGEIGNSGASGGVHVHFERRTGPGIAGIVTLPPYFSRVRVQGAAAAPAPIALDTGDIVVSRP
jgi:hypothetical protein